MPEYIRQKFSSLLDHYVVVDLLLALVILTHIGVGDIRIVSLLGIFLCMVGFLQPPAPMITMSTMQVSLLLNLNFAIFYVKNRTARSVPSRGRGLGCPAHSVLNHSA